MRIKKKSLCGEKYVLLCGNDGAFTLVRVIDQRHISEIQNDVES